MKLDQIRKEYLDFFRRKDHSVRPSAPLIPPGDTTMLFTSAGMVPFKDNFFGIAADPLARAASCQKCLRETDLESVGRTPRHHTFFEMLGNFSFGDYFKEEAILWGWEFCVDVMNMDAERIHVSVFEKDDEAWDIWHKEVGIPESRLIRLGEDDNFWKMGDTGPCGPCSELYIDRGVKTGCGAAACAPGCDCDRFLEFWNLVFTQFDRQADGSLVELKARNIDTGLGLDRMAAILQDVETNFDTDAFSPILSYEQELSGVEYGYYAERDVSFRVIADHIRCVTMAISDGIYPSNEGRGYVIRRILRRAARHGINLGIDDTFLHKLVPPVVSCMQGGYPGLMRMREQIAKVVKAEEERFKSTLDHGIRILEEHFAADDGKKKISAQAAFKLFDTYGFPLDLTVDMAEERGFVVDVDGFRSLMEGQREKARASTNLGYAGDEQESPYQKILVDHGKTQFIGYEGGTGGGRILAILRDGKPVDFIPEGSTCELILDTTPFYGESGGQVGDTGRITTDSARARVLDAQKHEGVISHVVELEQGSLKVEDTISAEVDDVRRHRIRGAHTATHLLQAVLRDVLGDHVQQSGSKVDPDRLRFDFSHFEAVKDEDLEEIERRVNQEIRANHGVGATLKSLDDAMSSGAMALFDEKYGEEVRVVNVGDVSLELCGGTHVSQTGAIGLFRVASESALAAGIRRIEALTGEMAVEQSLRNDSILKQLQRLFNCRTDEAVPQVEKLLENNRSLEKDLAGFRKQVIAQKAAKVADAATRIGDMGFVVERLAGLSGDELREACDTVLARLGEGTVVLASVVDGKVIFSAKVSPAALKRKVHAGNLLREAAKVCKGGGGGRPDMAQAGGRDPGQLDNALGGARDTLRGLLS